MDRRSFLIGLGASLAAPAIIRPGILMPVRRPLILPHQLNVGDWIGIDLGSRSGIYQVTAVYRPSVGVVHLEVAGGESFHLTGVSL